MNRGAGYGQEVPCVFRLYGPKGLIDALIAYGVLASFYILVWLYDCVQFSAFPLVPSVRCPLTEVILYAG